MRSLAGQTLLAAGLHVALALVLALPLRAEPEEPPAPPAPSLGPAPDVRARPPEPPAPGESAPDWDKDWRSRGVGLGPPLPPPDVFAPRPIPYRHDTREVSLDARIKPVKRVPQWVDVVERDEIIRWRPMDLGDFARRMPNVMIADGGSPFLQIPIIRGLGGTRVRVLTDGVWPVAQALGLRGTTLSLWDPESTDRMEIYHGPGAYLKSIDSPGGLINIVPRRPRRHGRLSADGMGAVAYDSATQAFRGRAEADIGQDRIAGLAGVTWTSRGDRMTPGGTLENSSYNQLAADLALDYFVDNRSRIGLTLQYNEGTDIQSPNSVAPDLTQPSMERTYIALSFSSFDAGGIFGGTKASIALDSFTSAEDDAFSGLSAGIAGEDEADRYQFSLQGNLYLHACHDTYAELTFGYASLNRTETIIATEPICGGAGGDDQGMAGIASKVGFAPSTYADLGCATGLTRSFEAEEIYLSLLVEDQTHSDCWDTHIGFRVDWYHIEDNRVPTSESKFLGGIAGGVARHLNDRYTVFANASAGWRRPTLYELNSTAVIDGTTVFGNSDLDPELHINGELGFKSALKNRASFSTVGFVHYMDDFIGGYDLVPVFGPTQELRNLGSVLLYGGELTGAWRPWHTIEGAELYGSAGITLSSDEAIVANVPFLWRAGMRYSVPQPCPYYVRRWFADFALHGASNSEDGPRGGDAYVTSELLVGTDVNLGSRRRAHLNLGLTNLFDADYTPPASRLPAPGMSFMANFEVDL